MSKTRQVLVRSNAGRLDVIEQEAPQPKAGQVLVEVEASVISPGTELGGLKGRPEISPEDEKWRSFGYQNAGRVVELGEGVSEFSVGERVACMGGGYAEHGTYASVPVNLAVPIPDEVSFEEGAFIALAATALNAVRRAELQLGEFSLVVGLGIVGQLTAQLSGIAGTHVLGLDRFRLRTDAATRCGVERVATGDDSLPEVVDEFARGYGMDAAFICFGGEATPVFDQIVKVMKHTPDTHVMGRVVIPGGAQVTHRFGAGLGNLDIRSAARTGPGYHDEAYEHGREYPRVFVPWTTKRNLEECINWIATGRLNVNELITHRYPIERADEACRTIIDHPEQTLGVVITMK